jgi:flavodoxin
VSGKIVDLPIGNTEVIAKRIQEATGEELFHIDTKKQYPKEYQEMTAVADKEFHGNARPELSNHVVGMDGYQVIFLGYPIWWGTMPMAVYTFLEEYDFSGKTIVPFCTHEGSGLGTSVKDIARLCPKANVMDAKAFLGSTVNDARGEVERWIRTRG